jgi:hypothetical protein
LKRKGIDVLEWIEAGKSSLREAINLAKKTDTFNLNSPEYTNDRTLLHKVLSYHPKIIATQGFASALTVLLQEGANPDCKDASGQTPRDLCAAMLQQAQNSVKHSKIIDELQQIAGLLDAHSQEFQQKVQEAFGNELKNLFAEKELTKILLEFAGKDIGYLPDSRKYIEGLEMGLRSSSALASEEKSSSTQLLRAPAAAPRVHKPWDKSTPAERKVMLEDAMTQVEAKAKIIARPLRATDLGISHDSSSAHTPVVHKPPKLHDDNTKQRGRRGRG